MIAIHNIETLTPAVPVAGDTHGVPSATPIWLVMHPPPGCLHHNISHGTYNNEICSTAQTHIIIVQRYTLVYTNATKTDCKIALMPIDQLIMTQTYTKFHNKIKLFTIGSNTFLTVVH